MSFAALFPGQGSQVVGMGADLFDARSDLLGERSDEILGWSLRSMCLDGPEEALTRTEHAQPALFALSYALWEAFASSSASEPTAAAGHSLGEYTALVAAGSIGYDEGLGLVARRGKAMAAAADAERTGMAALIGADLDLAEAVVAAGSERGGSLSIANINAPGQVVVAGRISDIDWVVEEGRSLGVRRAVPLKVAGAFHTAFMEPARLEVAEALARVHVLPPRFPVWSNTTALPHVGDEIAETLGRQVVSPVRFSESLTGMAAQGVGAFVHVGPGDVTAGMAKRTVPEAEILTVSTLEDVDEAVAAISTMA